MTVSRRRPITKKTTLTIYVRDNGICGFCGENVPIDEVSIDHIQPVALGGSDDLSNLRLAHRRCNTSRGIRRPVREPRRPRPIIPKNPNAKTISEWRAVRGMTQQQLAIAANVHPQMVSQWETSRRGMTARNLQAVAAALSVSMDAIALPGDNKESGG